MTILERQPLLDAIADVVSSSSDPDSGLRLVERYSGRGMYKRECVGIAADTQVSIVAVLINLACDYDREVVMNMLENMTTDSLGLGVITYFPGFTLEADDV